MIAKWTESMPSPFPGMDPYLEGYLWPDVHSALAGKIRQLLTPLLRPRYTARLAVYVVEDSAPEGDIGIMYPDVEVMLMRSAGETAPSQAPDISLGDKSHLSQTPAALIVPVLLPIEVPLTVVEVHDAANNQLITSIEILSPVHKREPGLAPYRQKRQRLYQAGVHLIELDLLRRGTRPVSHPRIPPAHYLVGLTRAHSGGTQVWTLSIRDSLPIIPIPLRLPDDDMLLDLSAALNAVYDEAAYDLSINYHQSPPPPDFSEADIQWMRERIET